MLKLGDMIMRKKVPFKFLSFWVDLPNFVPLVVRAWNRSVSRVPMFRVVSKLKLLKKVLKELK